MTTLAQLQKAIVKVAFDKWITRFGSRPWQDELQKAFEAGYRAALKD